MKFKLNNIVEPETRVAPVTLLLRNEETGEFYDHPTTVEYYTYTTKNYRSQGLKDAEGELGGLEKRLKNFPELVDDDGNPVPVTRELLEGFHSANLSRIAEALRADANPKSQPVSSPDSSKQGQTDGQS